MRIQAYTLYTGTINILVASTRPEEAPSTRLTAAKLHDDYCAKVRALLLEHKQCGDSSLEYAASKKVQSYFPTNAGLPIYALRQLQPAGAMRDIDPQFMLEILRMRFDFALNLLPVAHTANEIDAYAFERNIEFAIRQLFDANSIPHLFIPGDNSILPGVESAISISVDMGPAGQRTGIDIPQPS